MSAPIATRVTFMDGPLALTQRILTVDRTVQWVKVMEAPEPVSVYEPFDPFKTVRILTYELHAYECNAPGRTGIEYLAWLAQ